MVKTLSLILTLIVWSANGEAEVECAGSYGALVGRPSEENAVQRWIRNQQPELSKFAKFKTKVGGELLVNGRTLRVRALLGKGAAAAVYLVETPGGLRVTKVYDNEGFLRGDLSEIARFGTWGGLPEIFEHDEQTRTILMEYVEGIPMDQILNPHSDLGLSRSERAHIEQLWQNRIEDLEATAPPGAVIMEKNVVYSIKEDKIRIIDPN